MRTQAQSSPERSRLAAMLEPMSVGMLTTRDDDGALASRPMTPIEMDARGALWFFTDLRLVRAEHLRELNLGFSDESRACYVSLSGRGDVYNEREQIERLWTPFSKPWFPDGSASVTLALLKFVPDSADVWDARQRKMVRLFALPTTVLAGRPFGVLAHHPPSPISRRITGFAHG